MRPVVDLLVEQVECADFVLLNKVDLLPGGTEGEALEQLSAIVSSLNPLATVIACEQAKVSPVSAVLGGLVGERASGNWRYRRFAPRQGTVFDRRHRSTAMCCFQDLPGPVVLHCSQLSLSRA
jgi:G3E family GTPase